MATDGAAGNQTPRLAWPAAAWLLAAAAAAAAVILLINAATRDRAALNEARQALVLLRPLLPAGSYDNQPVTDRILVTAPDLLGSGAPLPVYRARYQGEPVSAVITVVARQGFVGPIRLLVSVGIDGRVIAVRAIAHDETPGLGDRINRTASDWVSGFTDRSLRNPDPAGWTVRRDGGEFDQLTGATVTSRAVVTAVRNAVMFFERERATLFTRPAQ